MTQPDGRGTGTPGGEAAITFLTSELDARGLAAPRSGRIQALFAATRRSSGLGLLSWDRAGLEPPARYDDLSEVLLRRTRTVGDGWDVVPGSGAGVYPHVRIDDTRSTAPRGTILAASGYPAAWLVHDDHVEPDGYLPQLRLDPELRAELGGRRFDFALPSAVVPTANVLAWIPGAGALADEVVLLGAHHDHLAPLGPHTFPGADDNASGTAAALCALAAYAEAPPKGPDHRAILAVWFGAEEEGLWGSQAFVAEPAVPLEAVSAALVLDMVGRLDGGLRIKGPDSGEWVTRLDQLAVAHGLVILPGEADHMSDDASFAVLGIPTAHFFTGLHPDYHLPTDTVERLDRVGLERITHLTADTLRHLAAGPALARHEVTDAGIRLGGVSASGHPIVGDVVPGTAADRLGVVAGSTVIRCGGLDRIEPVRWLVDPNLWGCEFAP